MWTRYNPAGQVTPMSYLISVRNPGSGSRAVSDFQDLFTNILCDALEFLHCLADASACSFVATTGLINVILDFSDDSLQFLEGFHLCLSGACRLQSGLVVPPALGPGIICTKLMLFLIGQ